MQEWLDNNDILMHFTHNEGKSVTVVRIIKTLKSKIYKRMSANDSKSYLLYLNILVDQYHNTYHHSINEKLTNADYSVLTENIESYSKAPKFKVNDRIKLLSIRIYLVKVTLKIGQEKYWDI